MVNTVPDLVLLGISTILGVLLSILVIAFVFNSKFRRELLRARNQETNAAARSEPGSFSIAAKGAILGILGLFLAALVALALMPRLSASKLASSDQESEARDAATQAQADLAAAIASNAKLAQEAQKLRDIKIEAFYTGEYGRAAFGTHFACYTNPAAAAQRVCGSQVPATIKVVASHSGNRCGYNYYAVACVRE